MNRRPLESINHNDYFQMLRLHLLEARVTKDRKTLIVDERFKIEYKEELTVKKGRWQIHMLSPIENYWCCSMVSGNKKAILGAGTIFEDTQTPSINNPEDTSNVK